MTSVTLLILMELVRSEEHLGVHAVAGVKVWRVEGVKVMYGYSFLLAWVVLIAYFVAAIAFFAGSRKRKKLPYDFEQCLN